MLLILEHDNKAETLQFILAGSEGLSPIVHYVQSEG